METSIYTIIDIFESLSLTTSLNKRRAILTTNRNDRLFAEVVLYFLGYVPSGITRNNIDKPIYHIVKPKQLTSFGELVDYIKKHPACNDDDILVIQYFLKGKHRDERESWKKIICREYGFGLRSETVQEIMRGGFNEGAYFRCGKTD